MFQTIRLILYANKMSNKYNKLEIINKIDAEIASQKFFVRFSYKNRYISHNNYYEWSKRLDEIGKILQKDSKSIDNCIQRLRKKIKDLVDTTQNM